MDECVGVDAGTCHLLNLSADVWSERLIPLLNGDAANVLWHCYDKRLQQLLQQLSPHYFLVNVGTKRTPIVERLTQRTRHDVVIWSKNGHVPQLASDATSVHAMFKTIETPISFAHWPHLTSLKLVCTANDQDTSKLPLIELIESLPATLTSLSLTDENNGSSKAGLALPCLLVISTIGAALPNLTSLSLMSHKLAFPSADYDLRAAWPEGLVDMRLRFDVQRRGAKLLSLRLPSTLTRLQLSVSPVLISVAVGPTIKASSLPSGLLHLRAPLMELDYDAPLPHGIKTVYIARCKPSMTTAPFTLPSTIEFAAPIHIDENLCRVEARIRIIARAGRRVEPIVLPPLDDAAVKEWEKYEQLADFEKSADLATLASSFYPLDTIDFFDHGRNRTEMALVKNGLAEVYAARVGKAARRLLNVPPSMVVPLIKHCKWLTMLDIADVEGTEAFFSHLFAEFSKGSRSTLSHLLTDLYVAIELHVGNDLIVHQAGYPNMQFESIRKLVNVKEDVGDVVYRDKLATALNKMFPRSHLSK